MGVEPFLLSSTLNLVVAQRLVRKICKACVASISLGEDEKTRLANAVKILSGSRELHLPNKFYKGKGCKECGGSGFKGRIGIFEVLQATPAMQALISAKLSEDKVKAQALKDGMVTMLEDGFAKVEAGTTTLEEVLRVTRE
jgi:type II secretory ATPase GspE/PulE/Tfp pilus assembly ATPase PilB-like protein